MYTDILIRYGDMTIKGKNRKKFVQLLAKRFAEVFVDFDQLIIDVDFERTFITLNGTPIDAITNKLSYIFGLHSYSLVVKCDQDIATIAQTALAFVEQEIGENKAKNRGQIPTFKVETKRSNKNFPYESLEVSKFVASHIFKNTTLKLKVDVRSPEYELMIEIRKDVAYVMFGKVLLSGGFPQGSGGHGLLLLSGGIDSPVAGFLAMRKGIKLSAIHFASPPYTSPQALDKVIELLKKLENYQAEITLYVVPFTEIQQTIIQADVKESYQMILMRRMMFRIAAKLAQKIKAQALITGESVGQVASQTLESMQTTHAVTNLPIIQPLATYDKQEIVQIALDIDTYKLSTLPFDDCCTLFVPKHPETKPRVNIALKQENVFDVNLLTEKASINIEIIEKIKEKQFFL